MTNAVDDSVINRQVAILNAAWAPANFFFLLVSIDHVVNPLWGFVNVYRSASLCLPAWGSLWACICGRQLSHTSFSFV